MSQKTINAHFIVHRCTIKCANFQIFSAFEQSNMKKFYLSSVISGYKIALAAITKDYICDLHGR